MCLLYSESDVFLLAYYVLFPQLMVQIIKKKIGILQIPILSLDPDE